MDKFFAKGLAESTQRAYRCGQTKFLQFCEAGGFRAVPVTEATLCKFVGRVAESGLKHHTIKVYLSAVRHPSHTRMVMGPFEPSCPRLYYILQRVKRAEAEKGLSLPKAAHLT